MVAVLASSVFISTAAAQNATQVTTDNPDIPADIVRGRTIDKTEYLQRRAEYIALRRGAESGKAFDPAARQQALVTLNNRIAAQRGGATVNTWMPLGPTPIPNGQTSPSLPVSGRAIAIAIHPLDEDLVYVGTANGGLYRSLDGGTNWTPMMDDALSLAIGAVAIAPSQPDTIYVGTGEPNFSIDSFFGVGVYRIDNASSATPVISGPLNLDAGGNDIFSGRGISEIQIHPTNPDIIFVASTSGSASIGSVGPPNFPSRGVYRSVNATSANPVFEKLTGLAGDANSSVRDIVIDPMNPDLLVAAVVAGGLVGGLYTSTNALSATPTFTQTEVFDANSTSELATELAIHHVTGPTATIYAATGNGGGRVLMSLDNGVTWTEQIDNNFCTPQCFYDIAIAVDPVQPNVVYLGGSPALAFGFSVNAGVTFTSSGAGLHVDTHAIAVAPSDNSVIYFASDGGIYRSDNSGLNWTSLNNDSFSATQFQSIATHPTDPQFAIGGTQDNGTNFLRPDGSWFRADFGDGGFAAIDQNAGDVTNVRMYHTYFNAPTLQGYGTINNADNAAGGAWAFRGCQSSGTTVNGITCEGSILFYAPLTTGPGSPNTVYYGSDRLYRSDDEGLTHTVVSQAPLVLNTPISTIGIAPNDDDVRAVGLRDGALFRTIDGSAVLVDVDPSNSIPNAFVTDVVIDGSNNNVAYVTLATFAGPAVWKTENFLNDPPTWAASGTGLPNAPVNRLIIDPANAQLLYLGSDIGVFRSDDAGANWVPESNGLPRVPVFDMAFQAASNPGGRGTLRIATHGRGLYELQAVVVVDELFMDGFESP